MDKKVLTVDLVEVAILKSNPAQLSITAHGTVTTSGWSNGRLAPRIYVSPPTDGIWDYDFIATAPSGQALQVISGVSASLVESQIPEQMKGVRVHASSNDTVSMLSGARELGLPGLVGKATAGSGGQQETLGPRGSCSKCSCPSFRGDSGDPEHCINIRPPTKQLCGHPRSDH